MVNQPNHGRRPGPEVSPEPADIVAARAKAGLTQNEAQPIHTTCGAWQQWEAGDRRMRPAFFELLAIKAPGVLPGSAASRTRAALAKVAP